MSAGAAEPVIQVQMAKSRVEIVAPQQSDHAASEPDTLRLAGRALYGLLGFGDFVNLLLALFIDLGGGWLLRLRLLAAALGESRRRDRGRAEEAEESTRLAEKRHWSAGRVLWITFNRI